jgi:branched-chain amino acid transport system substrate-binding protein
MFPSYGSFNAQYKAPTTFGTFFKGQGVTKFASVGINILAAIGSVHEANLSVQKAGLKLVYSNTSSPVGTTNFGAIALALQASGANGLFLGMTANSNIALVTALKQVGDNIPVILGTGYGSDTLSSPPSVTAMQGVYILNWAQTQADNTTATKTEANALSKYEHFNLPPGSHVEQGYFSAEEFIEGLQADSQLTSAGFISAMRKMKTTAGGLFGTHTLDFSQYGNVAQGTGPGNCLWITQLQGSNFTVVAKADPVCGTLIPGTQMSGTG